MKLQIAVVGLRRRHLYGRTHHSVLSATRVQVAGPGGGRGGVQLHHRIPQLARVAFEECPTGVTDLSVQQATYIARAKSYLNAMRRVRLAQLECAWREHAWLTIRDLHVHVLVVHVRYRHC